MSLTARLLISGLISSLVLVAAVGSFLLWSHDAQGHAQVRGEAENRSSAAAQLLDRVTGPEVRFGASDLASTTALRTGLESADPAGSVRALVAAHEAVQIPGTDTAVLNRLGGVVYASARSDGVAIDAALPSLRAIFTGSTAKAQPSAGVEYVGNQVPAYDAAAPVVGSGGDLLGAVVYSAPLVGQLLRYQPVIGHYAIVFVSAQRGAPSLRFSGKGGVTQIGPPADLAAALAQPQGRGAVQEASYATPAGSVVTSFTPVAGPEGSPAGRVGVEVPLSAVVGQAGRDERAISLIAVSAALLTSLAIILFVNRFLRRPVARLERGVARIAAGDYATDIPVDADDELGRLAASVNRMGAQIAEHLRHRDEADLRLREVSRALTSTGNGVGSLRTAVLGAAAAIAGGLATAALLRREHDQLVPDAGDPGVTVSAAMVRNLLGGVSARGMDGQHHLLGVPLISQGKVTGALLTKAPAPASDTDQRALETLANNGAVALDNTRAQEQEREALRVLRELDAMKSEFMSIAQHELRTPVLSVLGGAELLRLAWPRWSEEAKVDALRDIELATRRLSGVVENIVQFSLLDNEAPVLELESVNVANALRAALNDLTSLFKGGLPVTVEVSCPDGLVATADRQRLHQVLRALLDNAVKFSRPGSTVRVRAWLTADPQRWQLDVSDQGTGIGAAALPRVFDRFFQEDQGLTRHHSGLGLGLAVVKRVCEEHGALLRVRSQVGCGSTFSLLWPGAAAAETRVHTLGGAAADPQPTSLARAV
ncbi:MAG: hypothetical protein NVSMB29_10580 [Candidatus Dormibacteria bacterium]